MPTINIATLSSPISSIELMDASRMARRESSLRRLGALVVPDMSAQQRVGFAQGALNKPWEPDSVAGASYWSPDGRRSTRVPRAHPETRVMSAAVRENADMVAAIESDTALGRFGEAAEIASIVVFLASPRTGPEAHHRTLTATARQGRW